MGDKVGDTLRGRAGNKVTHKVGEKLGDKLGENVGDQGAGGGVRRGGHDRAPTTRHLQSNDTVVAGLQIRRDEGAKSWDTQFLSIQPSPTQPAAYHRGKARPHHRRAHWRSIPPGTIYGSRVTAPQTPEATAATTAAAQGEPTWRHLAMPATIRATFDTGGAPHATPLNNITDLMSNLVNSTTTPSATAKLAKHRKGNSKSLQHSTAPPHTRHPTQHTSPRDTHRKVTIRSDERPRLPTV